MKLIISITLAAFMLTVMCLAQPRSMSNPRKVIKFTGEEHQAPTNPTQHVILVHGWLETGSSWKLMKQSLEKHQIGCHVIKLTPSDGRGGLEKLSEQLKEQIEEAHDADQNFSIVAFSMGGLVSRHYLQELGGADRCDHLITIASPHHGTHIAHLYPSKGVQQMRPDSKFLNKLKKSEDKLGDMAITSYRTPLDLVVVPSKNSEWDRADNISYNIPLHPMMVSSRKLIKDVVKRLTAEDEIDTR